MDFFGVRGKGVQPAGHPVVEPRPDSNDQVCIVHCQIGLIGAVHPEHAQKLLVAARIGPKPHKRERNRRAGQLDKTIKLLRRLRAGIDHPATAIEYRFFCRSDHGDRFLDFVLFRFQTGLIGPVFDLRVIFIRPERHQNIFRQIDDDRAGPAAARHVERFMHDPRQVLDVLHKIIVLRARAGNASSVRFLKRIIADQMGRHLPGETDHRNTVHQRIGQPCHRVGCPRTRRHQHDADLAGRPGVSFGHVHRTAFLADKHMA